MTPLPSAEKVVAEWRDAMESVPPEEWTASEQRGVPGHCFVAQVFAGDEGRSLACIDSTPDEAEASRLAAWIARCSPSGISGLLALIESQRATIERVERERDEAYDAPPGTIDALQAAFQGAEARVTALEAEKAGLVADKERLDFLDRCNAALNGRYGTNYGWSLVLTHNVTRLMLGRWMEVDLHDSEGGNTKLPSCRGAIDREMTRIDVARRAQALSRSSTEVKNDGA